MAEQTTTAILHNDSIYFRDDPNPKKKLEFRSFKGGTGGLLVDLEVFGGPDRGHYGLAISQQATIALRDWLTERIEAHGGKQS